jgi:hypothetical protein
LRVFFQAGYPALNIVACGVKVTETGKAQSLKFIVPAHKTLYFELCKTVVALGVKRMFFIYGQVLRLAKNRRAGGKNEVFDTGFRHGVKDIDGSVDIV